MTTATKHYTISKFRKGDKLPAGYVKGARFALTVEQVHDREGQHGQRYPNTARLWREWGMLGELICRRGNGHKLHIVRVHENGLVYEHAV